MRVAYDIQARDYNETLVKNISLFNKIDRAQEAADLQQKQITKQEAEISKLLRKKNNAPLWIGGGVIFGLITSAVISK